MKIKDVQPLILRIPFRDGGAGAGLFPSTWNQLEIVLVRIEADNGLVGWGEGFGYFCAEATAAMVRRGVAPLLVGREIGDLVALNEELQRRMVLPGRYGISTFAISGADIALWDLLGKAEGVPVSTLLGPSLRQTVTAYASLVRYGGVEAVTRHTTRALQDGFREVKLHEITLPEIHAGRAALGPDLPMTVDVNCNWSEAFTRQAIPELMAIRTRWLEEPIFPPEDFRGLAALRELGLPLAAGENACTAVQFAEMIRHRAVDYLQPSVTKVGGISECEKIRHLNREAGFATAPHSPYFGPGYLASLQLAAVDPHFTVFEYLYVEPEAWICRHFPLPERGLIPIPEGPGLGLDPSPEVIARYLTHTP